MDGGSVVVENPFILRTGRSCQGHCLQAAALLVVADKAIYSITDQGRAYFKELMASCAAGPVPLLFDFNVVITNLNKMDKADALELVSALRRSIQSSAESNEGYAREFADIPLVGRTIFEQQQLLYRALLEWLDHFEGQFLEE